ncbi:MAG: hypothetical protein GX631_03005 [Dehalococcoidales bacterium]|nr:hypothetical protein [Dehalococcoidales bacterium]
MNKTAEFSTGTIITAFHMGDPFAYRRTVESEMQIDNRDSRDPNQAPKPDKGDRYILAVAFIGVIIGGIAGFFISLYGFGRQAVFLGVIAGIFVGGIIGAYAGERLKQKKQEKTTVGK